MQEILKTDQDSAVDDNEQRSIDDKRTLGSKTNVITDESGVEPNGPDMEKEIHSQACIIDHLPHVLGVAVSVAKSWRSGAYLLLSDLSDACRWLELVIVHSPERCG